MLPLRALVSGRIPWHVIRAVNKSGATKRLSTLEAQLEALKRFFIGKPKEEVDEENWQKVAKDAKQSRKATYRKLYGKT